MDKTRLDHAIGWFRYEVATTLGFSGTRTGSFRLGLGPESLEIECPVEGSSAVSYFFVFSSVLGSVCRFGVGVVSSR